MANSMERPTDLSARPSESAADREAILGSRKQIGVWLVSAAIAFLSLGIFGLQEILLKLAVSNPSPVPAKVVRWILRVEIAGKACHVQGPLYLAENEFGPPEAKWNRLESAHHEAGWPDEFSSWCEIIPGKPVVGWLAFYVQRVSAADLENAKLTLQMMDSTGRLYEAPRQSTRLAA